MTYNVFGGTLNIAQLAQLAIHKTVSSQQLDKPVDEKSVKLVGEVVTEFCDVMCPCSETEMEHQWFRSGRFRDHTRVFLLLWSLVGAHVACRL